MTQSERSRKIEMVCEEILKKFPEHKKLKPTRKKWQSGSRSNDNKELILKEIMISAKKNEVSESLLIKLLL